jgi:hypothetical protein
MGTPALGAGASPAGSAPAGAGYTATTSSLGGPLFPDVNTAIPLTGRYIDPGTGQFDITSYGVAFGMGTVPQLVQIAVCNIDFSSIDVIGDDSASRVANLIAQALASFVSQRLLQIVAIQVDNFKQDGERGRLKWRDLTTNLEHSTQI